MWFIRCLFFILECGKMAAAKKNTQVNNADQVEVLTYAEQIESIFLDLYAKYDVANAPEKKRANIIDTFWKDIYTQLFKPETKQNNNCKSKIKPYDVNTIESILDTFVMLCNRYGGVILIDSFCNLIGYNRYTLYLWNKANKSNRYIFNIDPNYIDDEYNNISIIYDGNSINCINDNSNIFRYNRDKDSQILSRIRFDVVKKLREEEQKQSKLHLSNSDIGMIFRSNNEDELGLKYDAKRTFEQETIKQSLSVQDLPKLNMNTETPQSLIDKGL